MNIIKKIRQAAIAFAGIFSTSFGKTLERKFGNIIDETATPYDAKIDKFYNDSIRDAETNYGSYDHRHFDFSHTPIKMWEKVKETFPDDSRIEELNNYFSSLWLCLPVLISSLWFFIEKFQTGLLPSIEPFYPGMTISIFFYLALMLSPKDNRLVYDSMSTK